ncbi:MAG: hypothetical protein A2Y91_00220 [Chloroflexi bacterium RBG_13_54_8]|nr:MAG: hypothetical protein A2Y91_00220 [Chloroflexi bacterium RBG_13_54_8]
MQDKINALEGLRYLWGQYLCSFGDVRIRYQPNAHLTYHYGCCLFWMSRKPKGNNPVLAVLLHLVLY